jgi:hypothetical protein
VVSAGIPREQRELVQRRDQRRCTRCGMRGSDWHHRRSRRVRDVHQHCACNGVMLCRTCHSWAHGHPEEALTVGLIVSQWEGRPWSVPLRRVDGWWLLRCMGEGVPLRVEDVREGLVPGVLAEAQSRLMLDFAADVW